MSIALIVIRTRPCMGELYVRRRAGRTRGGHAQRTQELLSLWIKKKSQKHTAKTVFDTRRRRRRWQSSMDSCERYRKTTDINHEGGGETTARGVRTTLPRRFIATEKVGGGGGGGHGGGGVLTDTGCGGWSEFAVNRSQSFRRNIARAQCFFPPPAGATTAPRVPSPQPRGRGVRRGPRG